ncbi:hypothetical protein V500_06509 [Pseudogymnoascus sp. VKM F-4518 (FW-2643)]|nr:hypothetical protein V500_06509 [Pseudogymnoascus sp. VKM F-4518 (FW-2643)]
MSSYYHYNAHQHPATQNHAGRSPSITTFRQKFEAGRSFDLDDDMEFCPGLLTEIDMQSIHSVSDRSSLSSGSPESSPTQQAQQVTAPFPLNSASNPYVPSGYQPSNLKVHQPAPTRVRNAIPIVNPSTRMSSPPSSVSPSRMHPQQQQQNIGRRWRLISWLWVPTSTSDWPDAAINGFSVQIRKTFYDLLSFRWAKEDIDTFCS